MKTFSPLLLCLCAVLMASPSNALADDNTSPSSDGSGTGTTAAQRVQRMKEVFAQLDLTDEQKQQIKQIRQTVTDKTERRQQILAVLTPEQKQKFWQLLQQYRNNGNSGGGCNAGPGDGTSAVAGDGSDLAPGTN